MAAPSDAAPLHPPFAPVLVWELYGPCKRCTTHVVHTRAQPIRVHDCPRVAFQCRFCGAVHRLQAVSVLFDFFSSFLAVSRAQRTDSETEIFATPPAPVTDSFYQSFALRALLENYSNFRTPLFHSKVESKPRAIRMSIRNLQLNSTQLRKRKIRRC